VFFAGARLILWVLAAVGLAAVAGSVPAGRALAAALLLPAVLLLPTLFNPARWGRAGRPRRWPIVLAVREARARPTLQWLGEGVEWTPARAARSARAGGAVQVVSAAGGRRAPIRIPLGVLSSHLLVLGQTGSGKTRLASLLATSFVGRHPDGALILLDPKGDRGLRDGLHCACVVAGRPQAFIELDPGQPSSSVRFDPMRNYLRTTSLASRVTALLPDAAQGSPFAAFAWRQLLLLADALIYLGERPTLAALRAAVEADGRPLLARALRTWAQRMPPDAISGTARSGAARAPGDRSLAAYRAAVGRDPGCAEPVIDALVEAVAHDRTHRSKMIQSLLPVLAALTAGELRALLSPADGGADPRPVFDTNKVLEQARVMYVSLPVLTDPLVGAAVGSLLLADLAQVAGQRARAGGAPVLIVIDEAAELAGEPLLQLLNKSRSARFGLVLASQTVHDFEARIGSGAMAAALLGNPGNVILMRTSDAATQRFFSDALPTIDRHDRGEGRSIGHGGSPGRPARQATASWHTRRTPAPWVDPGAFAQLPDLHFFARTADGRIWRGEVPVLEHSPPC